jgi:hypothetical protein
MNQLSIEALGVEVNKSGQPYVLFRTNNRIDGRLSLIEPLFSGSGGTIFSTARVLRAQIQSCLQNRFKLTPLPFPNRSRFEETNDL